VELWQKTLLEISTVFGRLVYLASLRDAATNRYAHASLSALLAPEEVDRTLCHSHHQIFSQWIGFSLSEQKADLDLYIRDAGGGKYLLQQYGCLIPPTAREVERQLYLTDLETLVELLRYGAGGAYAAPGA
jgi:hypothetical protein